MFAIYKIETISRFKLTCKASTGSKLQFQPIKRTGRQQVHTWNPTNIRMRDISGH